MITRDYANLFFSIRQNIYFYWNFFIIGTIATIGWIASWKKPPSLLLKLSLTTIIILIALSCLMSQLLNYSLLEAARRDWFNSGKTEQDSGNLIKHIGNMNYAHHKYLIWGVHIFLCLGVIAFIWLWKVLKA